LFRPSWMSVFISGGVPSPPFPHESILYYEFPLSRFPTTPLVHDSHAFSELSFSLEELHVAGVSVPETRFEGVVSPPTRLTLSMQAAYAFHKHSSKAISPTLSSPQVSKSPQSYSLSLLEIPFPPPNVVFFVTKAPLKYDFYLFFVEERPLSLLPFPFFLPPIVVCEFRSKAFAPSLDEKCHLFFLNDVPFFLPRRSCGEKASCKSFLFV